MPDRLTPSDFHAARREFGLRGTPAEKPEEIKRWQRALGVTADGIPGRLTYAALNEHAPDGYGAPEPEPERPTEPDTELPDFTEWKPARLHRLSDRGLAFLKAHEGFRANWYRDPVGVRTIGYGHTGPLPSGFTAPLTESQAAKLMMQRVDREFGEAVRSALGRKSETSSFEALTFRYPRAGLSRLWEAIRRKGVEQHVHSVSVSGGRSAAPGSAPSGHRGCGRGCGPGARPRASRLRA